MAVDKNLFLYDLAVVAIMKNEGPYAKEWLDYHLLAGVNHFYIYDNESPDNLKEVLQPYIDCGIVTYHFYPGKARQYEAYNDATRDYRFYCRYMAFIDADEFIFPQSNRSIVEVVDEILDNKPNAGGLAVNIFNFGTNYQDKANYTLGVLVRCNRRLPNDKMSAVKTIMIPRRIDYFYNPHFAQYFENYNAVNENGKIVPFAGNTPPTIEKIAINHYPVKSREEWENKVRRGTADAYHNVYSVGENFNHDTESNEVLDLSILAYHKARHNAILQNGGGQKALEILFARNQIDYNRVYNALVSTLSPTFSKDVPISFFSGKLETFLICRRLAVLLREYALDDKFGNYLEELSLKNIYGCFLTSVPTPDIRLLLSELPNILVLDYPVVKDIRKVCMNIIPQVINVFKVYNAYSWKIIVDLKYLMNMLNVLEVKDK